MEIIVMYPSTAHTALRDGEVVLTILGHDDGRAVPPGLEVDGHVGIPLGKGDHLILDEVPAEG